MPVNIDRSDPAGALTSDSPIPVGARERALAVARDHRVRLGGLPTVSALANAAGVARGTAATALQELRADVRVPAGTATVAHGEG